MGHLPEIPGLVAIYYVDQQPIWPAVPRASLSVEGNQVIKYELQGREISAMQAGVQGPAQLGDSVGPCICQFRAPLKVRGTPDSGWAYCV